MFTRTIEIGEISYNIPNNRNHIGLHDGKFRKKKCVKVGICDEKNATDKEIEGLLELSGNHNIQKLYGHSFSDSKWFLALEMFDVTLEEHMKKPIPERTQVDPVSLMRGITNGLNYLHDLKIFHGSISSKNIGICYKRKCAKICIVVQDDQKDVTLILTQPPIEKNFIKKDVADLCNVIVFLLNETMDFDAFDFIEKMKEKNDSKLNIDSFLKWISEYGSNLNHKTLLKLSMLRRIAVANSGLPLTTNSILHHPIFWKNKEKYEKIKQIAVQWKKESKENIEFINQMGLLFLKKCNRITKIEFICQNINHYVNNEHRMTNLVNCIASKMKYYQYEEKFGVLRHEHMFYFLEKFPFLFTFMIIVNDEICAKKRKDNKCGYLHDKFVNNNLPLELIIPPETIITNKMIKKSNAEVYDGKYNNSTVALKRISKMEFRLNEIKSIIKLMSRPETGSTCKSCVKEKCENVIGFHGCYENDEFVWIVMERAKEDFKDFQFSDHKMKLKILLDTVKGLECLHSNSISHLDIKPGNVLVVERNNKLVGCLADFGESIEAIKKTFTRTKIRGTDGYIAPELEEAFRSDQKVKTKNKKRFSLNYSKCDIYSLGMVIKKDYLEPINEKESLGMYKNLCEELINFMTEKDPTCRPDAEAVRKNPIFWDAEQKLKFLEFVHEYGENHTTNPVMKEYFENMIRVRKDWVNYLKFDEKIADEIQRYIKKKMKDQERADKSIFALVELILFIRSQEAEKCFQQTRKKLKINSDEFYLEFWYNNFEISFLYYYMHDVLRYKREFYSTDQPKRLFTALKRAESFDVFPILLYAPSTTTFMLPEFLSPEVKEFLIRAFSGLFETNSTRALGRLVGWSGLRPIEPKSD